MITYLALILAIMIVGGKARIDYLRAFERYLITHNGYYYVVRDKRGRFVTITNNFWDICKLGV